MKNTYKVGMISLGCPKNQVDGELLLEKLSENGFQIVQRIEDSDLMIINTCGFIEDAKREAIETILEVAQYKAAGVISAIVVTGCLAERYQDQVMEEIPEVDAVIGIGANADIVKVCQKALCGVQTNFFPCKEFLPLEGERMLSTPAHWAYLKISDGCSNCCSYCAIPGIRGPFRSRPMESVVAEAESLAKRGVKELILIAQDTTLYGKWTVARGNLSVSKTVTGNAGDTSKAFNFTVTLGNTEINGVFGEMTFVGGVATFVLKHGESKTATGLPSGVSHS